jgi:precorrin-2 dehydrogenase
VSLPPGYPVVLLVESRPCLVVGAGRVGAGKAAGLLAAGAAVTVVAPDVCTEVESMVGDGEVRLERRPYRAGEAAEYDLVVTATGDPDVDGVVAADATAAGRFVNSADDPAHCSFVLPSVHREGPVTVAVSTGWESPALSAWLRRRLGEAGGPGLGTLATLLGEERRRRRADGRPAPDWGALLDGPLPDLVAEGRLEEAATLLEHS